MSDRHAPPPTDLELLQALRALKADATKTPWARGWISGICRNPEHGKAMRHPGPPECVYVVPSDDGEIASLDAMKSVVSVHYDELRIDPPDSEFIVALVNASDQLITMAAKGLELAAENADLRAKISGPRK